MVIVKIVTRVPGGQRRVNYYIKHLMLDADGNFNETIEWTTVNGDPKLVCHPVLAMVETS